MSTDTPNQRILLNPILCVLGPLLGKGISSLSPWRLCCLVFLCVGPSIAKASPSSSSIETSETTNIQPPQLIREVELSYPDSARGSGQHGDVVILVDVDATGKVLGARFESGPEVFREASLDTVTRLEFSPATTNGNPVAVTTRVSFHFAPPPDGNSPDIYPNAQMVVHSANPDLEDTRARTTHTHYTCFPQAVKEAGLPRGRLLFQCLHTQTFVDRLSLSSSETQPTKIHYSTFHTLGTLMSSNSD